MHQSGQDRAHSMHTVQFSSLSAMTPRARGVACSFSCGYCTVTAGLNIVRNVTPRPDVMPLTCVGINFRPAISAASSERHLERAGHENVQERDGNEPFLRQRLELILAQAGVGEPGPEHQE